MGVDSTATLLEPQRNVLEQVLGVDLGPEGRGSYFLLQTNPKGHEETVAWPEIIRWMTIPIDRYRAALFPVFQNMDALS